MSSAETETWLPSLRALPEAGDAPNGSAPVERPPAHDPQAVGVIGSRPTTDLPTTVTSRYPLVIGADLRGSRLLRSAGPAFQFPKHLPHLGRRGPKPTSP